jgi:looped-hinge helix DNA binding domain, AbrB family
MKKATGIVRRIDDLGRIVIPKELRRTYGIAEGDPVEIYTSDEEIVLRKYKPAGGCSLCGTVADRYAEMGQYRICPGCAGLIVDKLQHS